jgi:hypothetical protein
MSELKGDVDRLKLLREPFPPSQIGKLPKGGIQLDFVGHGFITARLLDADPFWNWEPVALDDRGLPLLDEFGGLWIRLTVCGVTRLGYGDAGGRKGNNAVKEAIGDALRNAGMRFGLALDLWCKGDPDAPQPPTAEEKALGELRALCEDKKLDGKEIAGRFLADHGLDIRKADAETITAFTKKLREEQDKPADEVAVDKAAG